MMTFNANRAEIRRLSATLGGNAKRLKREITTAVNATSRKALSVSAKQVGRELATAQKNIKPTLNITKKANRSQAVPTAVVTQRKTSRIPLRDFGARQTKAGVAYRISKTSGRRTLKSAFIVKSIGGHVFKRTGVFGVATRGRSAGKRREKIAKRYGASPWGVFVRQDVKSYVIPVAEAELRKQIMRRTRFLKLKQSGVI
jgi:hypothetical protein